MALDLAGRGLLGRLGLFQRLDRASPTLRAMDLPKELVASSLRFSLGATTTDAEIDEAVRRIVHVCRELRTSM